MRLMPSVKSVNLFVRLQCIGYDMIKLCVSNLSEIEQSEAEL